MARHVHVTVGHGHGAHVGRRVFYLINERNGRCLDIEGGHSHAGANVIMYHRKPERAANQLWYQDEHGIIRSALNDFALDAGHRRERVEMKPYNGEPDRQWVFEHNRIVNKADPRFCLCIAHHDMRDEAPVIVKKYKGRPAEHWRVDYV